MGSCAYYAGTTGLFNGVRRNKSSAIVVMADRGLKADLNLKL